jgi:hypothetical protein
MDKLTLNYVWGQERIPVVLRRTEKGQHLRVRVPFAETNRQWLQNDRRTSPVWIAGKKYWELPKAWFNDFVERSWSNLARFTLFSPIASKRNALPRVRTRPDMSVSAPAWASITVREMTAVGSRCRTHLRRGGATSNLPVAS